MKKLLLGLLVGSQAVALIAFAQVNTSGARNTFTGQQETDPTTTFAPVDSGTFVDSSLSAKLVCTQLYTNMSRSMKGSSSEVSQLQKFLMTVYPDSFSSKEPTGIFGNETFAAVKRFQTDQGLVVTGRVGAVTRDAIRQASKCSPGETPPIYIPPTTTTTIIDGKKEVRPKKEARPKTGVSTQLQLPQGGEVYTTGQVLPIAILNPVEGVRYSVSLVGKAYQYGLGSMYTTQATDMLKAGLTLPSKKDFPVDLTGPNSVTIKVTCDGCVDMDSKYFTVKYPEATPGSIVVTSPTNGAKLDNGAPYQSTGKDNLLSKITWTSSGLGSLKINIDLLDSKGLIVGHIATDVENSGLFYWMQDPKLPNGNYKIVVSTSDKGPTVSAQAVSVEVVNSIFGQPVVPQSVVVTYPGPGTGYVAGVPGLIITWTVAGFIPKDIKIYLMPESGSMTTLASLGATQAQSASLNVPNVPTGSYMILVCEEGVATVSTKPICGNSGYITISNRSINPETPSISVGRTNPHGTIGETTTVTVKGSGATSVNVSAAPGYYCDFAATGIQLPFSYNGAVTTDFVKGRPQVCRWTIKDASGATNFDDDEFEYCPANTRWNGSSCASSLIPTISVIRTNVHGTVGEQTYIQVTATNATRARVTGCDFATSSSSPISLPFSYSGTITADFVKGSPQACTWVTLDGGTLVSASDNFQYCAAGSVWNGSTCSSAVCTDGSMLVNGICYKACPDGSRIPQNQTCPTSNKTCPDGTVIPLNEQCQKTCPNGTKIPETQTCPVNYTAQINNLYTSLLGRSADQTGLDYWNKIANEQGIRVIRTSFLKSSEYKNRLAGFGSASSTVNAAYRDILERSGDPDGIQHWINYLNGGGTVSTLVDAFLNSDEYKLKNKTSLIKSAVQVASLGGDAIKKLIASYYSLSTGGVATESQLNTWFMSVQKNAYGILAGLADIQKSFAETRPSGQQ